MFYNLEKHCSDLKIPNTFNKQNQDQAYFNTMGWRKLLLTVVDAAYNNPKLVNLRPLLVGIEGKKNGLIIKTTNNSQGVVTLVEVTHNGKQVNFKFKR